MAHGSSNTVERAGQVRTAAALWLPIVGTMALASILFGVAVSMYPVPPSVHDAYRYVRTAQGLLENGVYAYGGGTTPSAGVPPVYPLLIAGLLWVADVASGGTMGSGYTLLIGFQFLLAVGVVGLAAFSGRLVGGNRLAWIAGLLGSLYLPFAWASSVALTEMTGAFLSAVQIAVVLMLSRGGGARQWRWWVVLGIVSALQAMTRSDYVLWPILALALLVWPRRKETAVWHGLAMFALASLVVMAPWWIRNAVSLHQFIPLRQSAGFDAAAAGGEPLTAEEKRAQAKAIAKGGDSHWSVAIPRVVDAIRDDASGFAAEKAAIAVRAAWNPWEAVRDVLYEEVYHPDDARLDHSSGRWWPEPGLNRISPAVMTYHRILTVLAVIGLAFAFRSRRLALVASLPVYSLAVHTVTYFIPRYYFPVMPAVVLLAAAGLYSPWLVIARRRARRMATVAPSPTNGPALRDAIAREDIEEPDDHSGRQ